MINFRIDLFAENSQVAPASIPAKRKASENGDDDIEELWHHINHMDTSFAPIRKSILDKWCAKIKLASGSTGTNSHGGLKAVDTSTTMQITNMLADPERLKRRTQLCRSEYTILGKVDQPGEQYDTEIFDDEDFYSILLKEFIEARSNDGIITLFFLH